MTDSKKETITLELDADDYNYIEHAANTLGMTVEQFVETSIYMQIIDSLRNIKKEDLKKIHEQEELETQ